jgi:hypothetical protein
MFKNLSGTLFQQSFQMAGGGMTGTISTVITLPEATLILTQIPSHTLAANGGRVFASGVIRGGVGAVARGAAKGVTKLKPLGLGSTGRTTAANLTEQLAMKEAMSNPAAGQIKE